MAARRLIIVLVVLFAISIAAAAVAPQRSSLSPAEDETSASSTTRSGPDPTGSTNGSVRAGIEASVQRPEVVEVEVGDQLELIVASEVAMQVELPGLGLLDEATPDAPAQFNVLLRQADDLEIVDAADGDVIGRLLVADPNAAPGQASGKRPGSHDGSGPTTVEGQDGKRTGNG